MKTNRYNGARTLLKITKHMYRGYIRRAKNVQRCIQNMKKHNLLFIFRLSYDLEKTGQVMIIETGVDR